MGFGSADDNHSDIVIKGATDGTQVGNFSDKAKVASHLHPEPLFDVLYKKVYLLNGSSRLMNVNGSVTPQNFSFAPADGETWYIESLAIFLEDNGTLASGSFGAGAALTNGILLQVQSKGISLELAKITTNADLSMVFSSTLLTSALGDGFGDTKDLFGGMTSFQTPIKLTGSTDYVRFAIQDNLTILDRFIAMVTLWRTN